MNLIQNPWCETHTDNSNNMVCIMAWYQQWTVLRLHAEKPCKYAWTFALKSPNKTKIICKTNKNICMSKTSTLCGTLYGQALAPFNFYRFENFVCTFVLSSVENFNLINSAIHVNMCNSCTRRGRIHTQLNDLFKIRKLSHSFGWFCFDVCYMMQDISGFLHDFKGNHFNGEREKNRLTTNQKKKTCKSFCTYWVQCKWKR